MSEQAERVITLPTFIQVLVAQPVREGKGKNDRPYRFQELECVALDEHGAALQVGVLPCPSSKIGLVEPGVYTPVYGMRVDFQTRKIGPSIVDLNRVEQRQKVSAPAPAPAPKAS